jgi:hypothetical protein
MENSFFNRRDFLKLSATGAGVFLLPRMSWLQAATPSKEPHFFLQIVLNAGADCSYLFDARPLAMTAAGKIQNYSGVEPTLWTGTNGGACLAGLATAPLTKFRDRFSILNGVVMDTDFDGHTQNMNYLFTGNPFGGESFIPHLNLSESGFESAPFDGIQNGNLNANLANLAGIIPLEPESAGALGKQLGGLAPAAAGSSEAIDFIRSRYSAGAKSTGIFSTGSQQMLNGLDNSVSVQKKILQLAPPNPKATPDEAFVELACDSFRRGLSRSAVWIFPEGFDTHAPQDAKKQPKLFSSTAERLALIFQKLVDTPYDSTRSVLDVTTVMVASEFSRTMKNQGSDVADTGTNHNPLNNSILLGGKGIRSGYVVGASDFASAEETLSGAHLALDQKSIHMMGRPFDFRTLHSRSDSPKSFNIEDYLTVGSVINSIYSIFGLPESRYRTYSRSKPRIIPPLPGLLS